MYQNNDYRNYLMHHGILGMKWGVRRYQNADGSLTNAGKKRYARREKVYNELNAQNDKHKKWTAESVSKINDLEKNGVKSKAFKERFRKRKGGGYEDNYSDDVEDILTEREAKSRLLDDLKFDRDRYSSNVKIDNKKLKNIKQTSINKTSYAEAERINRFISSGIGIATYILPTAYVTYRGIKNKNFNPSTLVKLNLLTIPASLITAAVTEHAIDKHYDKKFNIGQYQSRNKVLNKYS